MVFITILQLIMLFIHLGSASEYTLLILHQGDIHSRFIPIDAFGITCTNEDFQRTMTCHGGFARAVDYVKKMKKEPFTKNVLVVNTGGFFYGEILHAIFKWRASAYLAKLMPYDALILGDKEFHGGLDQMMDFMRSLPSNLFVCTNMDFSKFNKTMKEELGERCPPHRILTIGEKKIGLLGYLTPNVMEPLKVPEVHIEDEIEALTREVAVLRKKGIKLIVALGHSGYERDQEIAHRVPSLDVIVGGHSHTLLWPDPISHQAPGVPPDPADAGNVRGPYPTVVVQPSGRRVLLLHAFFGGKYVGNINITFNADDEVKDWWPQPQLLDESMPQDPDTKEVMDDLQEQLTNRSHDVIGKSLVQLVGMAEMCHQEECNLGNLMGDAMLWALRMYVPDVPIQLPMVALVNSGLMRNNIQVGDVTPRMLTEALSWRNLVEVIVINGSMLHAALEHGSSTVEQRHGRFMQVSGISYQIDMSKPPYHRVSHVHVLSANDMIPESRLLNHSQHYHVALTNFIADGGDGFHMFTPPISRQSFGILDISLLQNYIIARSPVFAVVEDRIRMILPSGDGEEEHHHSGAGRPAVHLQHRPLLAAATALLVGAVAAAVVTS